MLHSLENEAYVSTQQQKRALAPGKTYHLFISYESGDDYEWIRNLISKLQKKGIICLDQSTEFQPGQRIFKNIEKVIDSSMKVLVVLSKSYINSRFCQHELDSLMHWNLQSKENLIIPVLKERCKDIIPECLKLITYIDATGDLNQWIPQIVKLFDQKDVRKSYLPQLDPVSQSRNLEKVYEEVSRICVMRLAFDSRRYLPDKLKDVSIPISIETFHRVLEDLSQSFFIRCACCYCITKICVVFFLLLMIWLAVMYCLDLLKQNFPQAWWKSVISLLLLNSGVHPLWYYYANRMKQKGRNGIALWETCSNRQMWICAVCLSVFCYNGILNYAVLIYLSYIFNGSIIFALLIMLMVITHWIYRWYKMLKHYGTIGCPLKSSGHRFVEAFFDGQTLTYAACFNSVCFIAAVLSCTPDRYHEGSQLALTTMSIVTILWVFCFYTMKEDELIETTLKDVNHYLIDCNLLLSYKVEKCLSRTHIVFVYFDARACLNYMESRLRQQGVVGNEPSDTIIKDDARRLLIDLVTDYLNDFFAERLENSDPARHTRVAICLCQYAEKRKCIS